MKKYKLEVILNDDNSLDLIGENAGFNAAELIGIFELKKRDIYEQISDTAGVKFKRTYKDGDYTEEIEDRETTEPAKIGQWFKFYDPLRHETHIKCSVCETVQVYPGKNIGHTPECPHCHAAMTETI